jgi:hypothetical protein
MLKPKLLQVFLLKSMFLRLISLNATA